MAQATNYCLITGPCPGTGNKDKCRATNTLRGVGGPGLSVVRCTTCHASQAIAHVNLAGRTCIELVQDTSSAAVASPLYQDIPQQDLIWRVLRQALITQFSIGPTNQGLSGVTGLVGGYPVLLVTMAPSGQLGLCRPSLLGDHNAGETAVLDYFMLMLRKLFFDELSIGEHPIGSARIFRTGKTATDELQIYAILGEVLAQVSGNPEFPRLVFSALARKHPEFLEKWASSQQTAVFSLLRRP